VFVEVMPLLKDRTLLLTIARVGQKVRVNVIPAKAKEGEDQALTIPLSYTASPEELDAEFGRHLASYVDTHLALGKPSRGPGSQPTTRTKNRSTVPCGPSFWTCIGSQP
jgi:PRTRC genetic system protein E